MEYGEKYTTSLVNRLTKKTMPITLTYRFVEYGSYHTDKTGCGIWLNDKQLVGTSDFSVAGCATEKSARAKLRKWVKNR